MKSARSQNYSRPSDPNWAESVFCMFRRMPQSCWWRSIFYVKRHAALHFLQTEGGQEYKRKKKRNQKSQERPIICEERCLFCCEGMKSRVKDSFSHAWLVANSLLCDSSFIFAQNPEKKGIIVSKVRVNYYSGIGIQRIIVPPLYTQQKQKFQFSKAQNWCGIIPPCIHQAVHYYCLRKPVTEPSIEEL